MEYIIRNFEEASFVFNPKKGNSLFIEGSLAPLAIELVNGGNTRLPESFLSQFDQENHQQIFQDWRIIRQDVEKFISGKTETNESVKENHLEKTALEKLSEYAIQNWQLTNANIELTNLCNQRCQWCYADDFQLKGLSRDRLSKLADELRKENVLFLLFTGGEIFLRPDAMEIINGFAEHNFIIELKTNGTLITDRIIEKLSLLPLLDVQVSIYGVSNGWFDQMQTIYPFNRIQDSVCKMVEVKVPVTLSVLVGRHNVDYLHDIHDCLSRLGAKIFYSPYITQKRSGPGEELLFRLSFREMEEKFRPFLEEIDALTPKKQYRNCEQDQTVCYAGRDQIAIGADGTVYPCLDLRLPMGNITEKTLAEIIPCRNKIVNQFNLSEIAKCNNCSLRNYCDSCVGVALIEHGDYRQPSQHKCDVIHFYSHERR